MEPARWERVKALFEDVFERPPAERAPILDAACQGDAELRASVQRLLDAHAVGPGPLDSPASVRPPAGGADSPPPPARIGPYRIVRELGRGGMGSVYLAERDEPGLRKTVAVKVVRPGMDSAFVLRRFHTERQILAGLEHPGIARLYDGGTTDEGLPYFVMEYVDGEDLVSHCDARRLPIRARLQLFLRACDAVQYAHQGLVVHRDLKPSNVLVTAAGEPKLLDFGIAKLLSFPAGPEGTDETASVVRLMTPGFASPEQERGERVTTASDVYSLGVILYELVSGHRPDAGGTGQPADRRLPSAHDIDPPSAASGRSRKARGPDGRPVVTTTPAEIAARRQATPGRLRRQLRGDLDNVVLKALQPDPAERYATAAELSDDLRRHLEAFPVRARPDRRVYRAAKFLRRHRVGIAAGSAALLGLVVGLAVAVQQARITRAALATSLLAQARFQRSTGRVGQRFETLGLVERAAALVPRTSASNARLAECRTEAAGALALADLRLLDRWPVFLGHYETEVDFTSDLERYVTAVPGGGFSIFATADRRPLRQFGGSPDNPAVRFRFSRDGRWLAATFQDGGVKVHSLVADQPARQWTAAKSVRAFVEFSPDSRGVLLAVEGLGGLWHELAGAAAVEPLMKPDRPEAVAFDPAAARLAMAAGRRCEVWRLPERQKLWSRAFPHRLIGLAWSADGRQLAASYDGRDEGKGRATFGSWLLDAEDGAVTATFADHESSAPRLAFDPEGGSIVSAGWDGRLVWRAARPDGFRVLGDGFTLALKFSADGRRLAFSPSLAELALAEVARPVAFREWLPVDPPTENAFDLEVSPDGTVLAVAANDGIYLWDTAAGQAVTRQPLSSAPEWVNLLFHPDGRSVVYSAEGLGTMRAALRTRPDGDGGRAATVELAPAVRIGPGTRHVAVEFAPDGRSLIVVESRRQDINDRTPPTVWLWPDMDASRARKLAADFPLVGYRLVADGKWGVSTDNVEVDQWIWDPQTGRRVRSLGLAGNVLSMSSNDTRWLVTATRDDFSLWDTSSWARAGGWKPRPGQHFGTPGQFSPDARWFATGDLAGQIEIRALPDGRELVSLPPPQPLRLRDFRFSPAGDRLYILRLDGRIYEWNLARLREELATLGLDWE